MRAILSTIIIASLLGGGGMYMWRYFGGFLNEQSQAIAFIDAYGEYADTAEQVELLVHVPGVENNSDRAELLALLNSILTENLESVRREELARLAFNNLTAIKKEIDAAQAAQAHLYETLQTLDMTSRAFTSIARLRGASDVVDLARKRAELTARITSILSETNDQTYAIITQILADGGALTNDHAQSINEGTSKAEERFDVLASLYSELIDLRAQLEKTFTTFAQDAI